MIRPNKSKSRTYRRIHVTTPGGNNIVQYKRRKPKKAQCVCGRPLQGVPHEIPTKMQQLPKTHKRPQRPFGGVLCSQCMRVKIAAGVLNV